MLLVRLVIQVYQAHDEGVGLTIITCMWRKQVWEPPWDGSIASFRDCRWLPRWRGNDAAAKRCSRPPPLLFAAASRCHVGKKSIHIVIIWTQACDKMLQRSTPACIL
ncbi:hypothetical protein NPIL_497691 [Nephila pilipes]|uniref:Uncharacterized protein n=1 Tax=Nephila pilipes TaxID=299642 RepID=A0A8X6QBX2_NEPPI|nr:hypothetical protein NPIL_497691 [Nephila pilipes]